MYKVILTDGTEIKDVELNGNNYVPKKTIDVNTFEGKTDTINIVNNEEIIETLKNVNVIFAEVSGKQSFILQEKSNDQIATENAIAEKEVLAQSVYELAEIMEMILMGGIE